MLHYPVAVRALCEFTAKQGDLDLRFTPSPTSLEGIEGHKLVAARRGPAYQRELPLRGEFGPLTVRGRADGYDASAGRLEEIKTHRGRLERQPANHRHLHWAQLKVYGALLCRAQGLAEVELALVYLEVASQQETVLVERHTAAALSTFFEARCAEFIAWAGQEMAHRAARDQALRALSFPHAAFRPGQRTLAGAVYRAVRAGRCLLAQAPTGIGKTVGCLFPLLKACPGERLDRIFFLTAKTSGRATALGALALLRGASLPLRVLELVARDKACEYPGRACHGEACPLAEGFYDRLPAARQAALALPVWDKPTVRTLAQRHHVCPYYLGQELARWSDVVVGDYNHFFDSSAMLHALSVMLDWRVAVLVDEAHNLVERARAMYSAELGATHLATALQAAPPSLEPALQRVRRSWRLMLHNASAGASPTARAAPTDVSLPAVPQSPAWYQVLRAPPPGLLQDLQHATQRIIEHLAEHSAPLEPALLGFLFAALQFVRRAEHFGDHSLCDLARNAQDEGGHLCLRNVVPASFLKARLATARSVTLFSATLQPQHYYREMLGLPDDTGWLDVAPPFHARQIEVRVAADISTRFQHRGASLLPLVERIAGQFQARPGNYLAFFSSFAHLEAVASRFAAQHPGVPAWQQSRGMGETAQAQFLERFQPGGQGVGFAVLGGAFGEGIDLPGDRLVGAFIASLGLPQVNPVNEQFRRRLDSLGGAGFDYIYLYPGLRKVVQAAGRVIRTPSDTGVVHLLDDRFLRPEVQALLPSWWQTGG